MANIAPPVFERLALGNEEEKWEGGGRNKEFWPKYLSPMIGSKIMLLLGTENWFTLLAFMIYISSHYWLAPVNHYLFYFLYLLWTI